MTKKPKGTGHPDSAKQAVHRMRLPGFISDEEVGLGDVVKRASSYLGIKPCGGCGRRTDALNRWLVFSNRQPK